MRNQIAIAAVAAASFVAGLGLIGGAETPSRADAPAKSKPAAPAQTATRQVIGDWVVLCTAAAQGHKSCVMTQTLSSQKLKKTVSVFSIGKTRGGKLVASLRMPVGVSLPAGVVVGIENQNPFTVPYTACHAAGCFAPFDLTQPLIDKMKKGGTITAVVQSVSAQPLSLAFSTRGFPGAYDAYLKQSQ